MHLETNSNVHGRTLYPFNHKLTPGGSYGGEGALVGFRVSPIGLAADGGGSIRSPTANNGPFGMKQTSNRVPVTGCTLPIKECTDFPVVVGPVCRSARVNAHFLKTVVDAQPSQTEQDLVPLPWRSVSLPEKIKIVIFEDDGAVRPHPPSQLRSSLLRKPRTVFRILKLLTGVPENMLKVTVLLDNYTSRTEALTIMGSWLRPTSRHCHYLIGL